MLSALVVFSELVQYESNTLKDFKCEPSASKRQREAALDIIAKNRLNLRAPNEYEYRSTATGTSYKVSSIPMSCTCKRFYKFRMCKHLAAVCIQDKVSVKGLPERLVYPKRLLTLRRRKRNTAADISVDDTAERPAEIAQALPPSDERATQIVGDIVEAVPTLNKRGRPPKLQV